MWFRNELSSLAEVSLYYIFWVWLCSLSYSANNAHVQYYIVICRLSGTIIFSHISHKRHEFTKKKIWKKNVFWISLQIFVWKISRSKKNSARSSCKVPRYFFLYRVIRKSVKHFKNSQQIEYAKDHGNSYVDRERNCWSFFKEKPAHTVALICR